MSERQQRVKEAIERLRAGITSGDFANDPEDDLAQIEEAVLGGEEG
jgi:hypothetical protein